MKKRSLLSVLMIAVLTLVAFAAIGCDKGNPEPGPESGVYYAQSDSGLPLEITLHSGNRFTFSIEGEIMAGKYSLKDSKLDFSFDNSGDGKITNATLINDAVNMTYNEQTYRFLKAILRTVTFNSNQGSPVNAVTVLNGKTLARPSDPTRIDYRFIGWYTNAECTTPFAFNSQIVTSDMTLFAYWGDSIPSNSEFTIDFDLNYESAPANPESVQTISHKLYNAPTPVRDGFSFGGWWISMYNDAQRLSYRVDIGTTPIAENATVYALWRTTAPSGNTPAAPVVNITPNSISWQPVLNANNYEVVVTDPNGVSALETSVSTPNTSVDFNFSQAGDYIISVKAVGLTQSSPATLRYYRANALAKVSLFSVVNSSVLLFNKVDNATNYLITIDCGNQYHSHNKLDNGSFTSYNFANCQMQPGGIKFIVEATAIGYATSVSKTFIHQKDLDVVNEFNVDDEQLLSWNVVPNATSYLVSIKADETVLAEEKVTRNSYSLKEFAAGTLSINITPQTIGFNSVESDTYVYAKAAISAPKNVAVVDKTIQWTKINDATSYTIRIGTQEITTSGNVDSYTLTDSELSAINSISGDYQLSVKSNGATASPFSNPVTVRNSIFDSIFYNAGFASWRYIIGAHKYTVSVNGGEPQEIIGSNRAPITFEHTDDGVNTISVMPYNAAGTSLSSAPITLDVLTYEITFDARGGTITTDKLYKAFGDPTDDFPTGSKDGFLLEGWYTAPGGAEQNAAKYQFDVFTGGEIVLYAYWKPHVETVSLQVGEGNLSGAAEIAYLQYNRSFSLPVPYINGNGFAGWYTMPNGQGIRYTDEQGNSRVNWGEISQTGTTLYAYYANILSYELNGNVYQVSKGSQYNLVSHVIIPDMYNGLNVTSADNLSNNTTESVTFGRNIAQIISGAFDGSDNLANFYVDKDNRFFSDINGILCNKAKTEIIKFPYARTIVEIPASITAIGKNAFKNCDKLTDVFIPSSVRIIGEDAFTNCINLRSITLLRGLQQIYDYAFLNCISLTEITIPADLMYIGESAFKNTIALEKITFAGASTNDLTISDKLFSECLSLKEVVFEPGSKLKNISASAFTLLKHLEEITIPASVTTISANAFQGCVGLKAIYFENNSALTSIGSNAFANTPNLKIVHFLGSSKLENLNTGIFTGTNVVEKLVLPSGLKTFHIDALKGFTSLKEITIPGTVTTIQQGLFSYCTSLEKFETTNEPDSNFTAIGGILYTADKLTLVRCPSAKEGSFTIPANVRNITDGALSDCTKITNVLVESGNTSFNVVNEALLAASNSALAYFPAANPATSFEVPASVEIIRSLAFSGNTNLTEITFQPGSKLTTIGDLAFNYCINLSSLVFPPSLENIGASAFNGCQSLNTFTLNDNITTIKANLFSGFSGLQTIIIPKTVTTIEANAFLDCVSLSQVTFTSDSALEKISQSAFKNCLSLKTFNFPNNVRIIEANAFQGSGLESVTIPNSITTLGNYAFADSVSLRTVVVKGGAESAQTFGSYIFSGCTTLTSVTYESDVLVTNVAAHSFSGTKITEFTAPASIKEISDNAFYGVNTLTRLTMSEGLERIGNDAFNSTSITLLYFPASLKEIGNYAFYNPHTNNRTVSLIVFTDEENNPSQLEKIGNYAFYLSNINGSLIFPRNLKSIGQYSFYNAYSTSGDYTYGITDIRVHANLETIGDHAFATCQKLNKFDISSTYGASKLKTIGIYAFDNCNITGQLTIPNSVTTIGIGAFRNNPLLSGVSLSSSLTRIESLTFSQTAITELTVPAGITRVDSYAFSKPSNVYGPTDYVVTKLTFEPESKLTTLGEFAFSTYSKSPVEITNVPWQLPIETIISSFHKSQAFLSTSDNTRFSSDNGVLYDITGTKLIRYPTDKDGIYTIPSKVTEIGEYAFSDLNKLSDLRFDQKNSQLTTIGKYAFALTITSSLLTRLTIPDSVINIEDYAFRNSKFETISISRTSKLERIGKGAFENSAITSIDLPSTLNYIGAEPFNGCPLVTINVDKNNTFFAISGYFLVNLTTNQIIASVNISGSFILPENITVIDDYAFAGRGLTSIVIHAGVTRIGNNAFQNCVKLTDVTIADNSQLEYLGNYAFENNIALRNFNFGKNSKLTKIGQYAFSRCTSLTQFTLPDSVETIDAYGFYKSNSISNFVIGENSALRYLMSYAFGDMSALTSFSFPSRFQGIGNGAFSGSGIRGAIHFPASLGGIAEDAFYATGISSITFANNSQIQTIGREAFQSCSSLASIDFGQGSLLTTIGYGAFNGSRLTSITLPNKVSTIGAGAFQGCKSLRGIYVESSNIYFTSVDGVLFNKAMTELYFFPVFTNAGNNGTYRVPDGVTTIAYGAFMAGGEFLLRRIILPETVTIIRTRAFGYFSGSGTSITIPYSVVIIENYAFESGANVNIVGRSASEAPSGWDDFWSSPGINVNWNYPAP